MNSDLQVFLRMEELFSDASKLNVNARVRAGMILCSNKEATVSVEPTVEAFSAFLDGVKFADACRD